MGFNKSVSASKDVYMARRYKHSLEEISTMILHTAETIVREEGYAALNARKIAMDIDYTVGSIYMVFENMADIVLHINAKTLDEIATYLEETQLKKQKISLKALFRSYFKYANKNLNRWRLLFEYRLPKDKPLPKWYQQQVAKNVATIENLFLKTLPERSDTDNKLAIQTLWASINGIYALSISNMPGAVNVSDIEASMVVLVDNFMAGWLANSKKN
jgi:AcrR family transcriptional regulator